MLSASIAAFEAQPEYSVTALAEIHEQLYRAVLQSWDRELAALFDSKLPGYWEERLAEEIAWRHPRNYPTRVRFWLRFQRGRMYDLRYRLSVAWDVIRERHECGW